MKIGVGVMLVLTVSAIAFAVFEPIQVLPRMRIGPGYSLTTAEGETFTSESVRGSVTLYSFVGDECDEACEDALETMRTVQRRVASEIEFDGVEFGLVTIAADIDVVDRDAPAGDDGWTFITGSTDELKTVISSGFERFFEAAPDGSVSLDGGFVLVDGNGIIRGDYRYQTLAEDQDKLVRHIDILAEELRNSGGASSVAYETAHLFLCYP